MNTVPGHIASLNIRVRYACKDDVIQNLPFSESGLVFLRIWVYLTVGRMHGIIEDKF